MKISRTIALLFAASAMTPMVALAQTAPPQDRATEVGEIVVTAQRREERLKDVPLSVTAVSAEQLEAAGAGSSTDLNQVVPGLNYPVAGAYAQPTIRGIGTAVTSAGSDPNVAMYVDGVYMPSQNGNIFDFNNIQQIEVLKGPQGTLFGRNATGGAITVTTLKPSSEPMAKLSAGYGSFNEVRLSAYVNAPIGDRLAFNIAANHRHDSGYAEDVFRSGNLASYKETSVRGKLLFELDEQTEFTLMADWARKQDLTGYALKPLNGNTSTIGAIIPPDEQDFALSFQPQFATESRGVALRGERRFDTLTLNAITSWRRVDADVLTDLDRTSAANSRASFGTRQQTFTQEVNLASNYDGPFNWIGGVFYYYDRANNDDLRVNGALGSVGMVRSQAEAIYVEANYDFSDRLRLIAGGRYSTEERLFTIRRQTGSPRTLTTSESWSAWTPRVSLRYSVTDAINVYATYSEGFKSGTYNVSAFSAVPVDPESVKALEAGLKYSSRGVSFNTAIFRYEYADIQVQAITPATGLTTLLNAAQAEIWGADAELNARLGEHWRINAGAAYTHARYSDFPNALITTPKTTPAACGANPNRPCGNTQAAGDASGNTMIRTPEVTVNLGATYKTDLAGGEFEANATAYYNGGFYWDAGNRLKQDAYTTFGGRLSWGPDGGGYRVSVWGRNLTDETYAMYVADTTAADGVAYARPRTFGVTLDITLD